MTPETTETLIPLHHLGGGVVPAARWAAATEAAITLLGDPAAWTQGAAARAANGDPVNPNDPAAVCWCAFGALAWGLDHTPPVPAVVPPGTAILEWDTGEEQAVITALLGITEGSPNSTTHLTNYNDAPSQTAAAVVARLRIVRNRIRQHWGI